MTFKVPPPPAIEVVDLTGEQEDDDIHVVPNAPGEREHVCSLSCWCGPTRSDDVPCVIVHARKAHA